MVNKQLEAVMVGAARTPTGKFLGGLSGLSATDLGAIAVREAVRRAGVEPAEIDEVIMGNVISAGLGQAPARQAAIRGGVPASVSALTINKVCGSGLKAVALATQSILLGDARIVVAGGMESMSNAPYLLPRARTGYRMGDGTLVDAVIHDGLWCSFENQHMGCAAEWIASAHQISREEQDRFSAASHARAVAAIAAGRFREEIVPVEVRDRRGSTTVEVDEPPRADTNLEALGKLKPAFAPDGTVTAGNAPGLSDGASATVVMEAGAARASGITALARVVGYASAALEPQRIFGAPVLAVRKLLQRTGERLEDFDLLEVNEAFAAQILANGKELGWDWDRVNVNGGAVALGHPVGSSGSRILITLVHELRRRGGGRGLAALCLGGGGAIAMSVVVE